MRLLRTSKAVSYRLRKLKQYRQVSTIGTRHSFNCVENLRR